jgi:hypothetical protein
MTFYEWLIGEHASRYWIHHEVDTWWELLSNWDRLLMFDAYQKALKEMGDGPAK